MLSAAISSNGQLSAMPPSRALAVGGVQWCSTVDFPDRLSAVIFCQGCSLRCAYCQNPDLIAPGPGRFDWAEILDQLARRRGFLDAVVFSGGEPLMQSALETAIRDVRALGFAVGIHTAGLVPGRFDRIAGDLDWVGLDIKTTQARYRALSGSTKAHRAAWQVHARLVERGISHEVRTTIWPAQVDSSDVRDIADRACRAGTRHFALQQVLHPRDRQRVQSDIFSDARLLEDLGRAFDQFECRAA